jgi:soluble lytic murein transglycosylase
VLAFSTIYDWRLNGTALPLTDRMRGNLAAARKPFVCPTLAAMHAESASPADTGTPPRSGTPR